jgi:hypothetical protein
MIREENQHKTFSYQWFGAVDTGGQGSDLRIGRTFGIGDFPIWKSRHNRIADPVNVPIYDIPPFVTMGTGVFDNGRG